MSEDSSDFQYPFGASSPKLASFWNRVSVFGTPQFAVGSFIE